MSRVFIPRRLARLIAILAISGLSLNQVVYAETDTEDKPSETAEKGSSVQLPSQFNSPQSYYMYNVLTGEFYREKGLLKQALEHYNLAALSSGDELVSQQAIALAMELGVYGDAQQIVEKWSASSPNSLEVHQSRLLLNARQGKYDEALKDLVWVRDHIEAKQGNGFEHIVSLLALEVGAQHSLEVFSRYADKEDDSVRVQLLLAHMALSAGNTELVTKATNAIIAKGTKEQKEQAAHLQAKAFMSASEADNESMEQGLKVLQPYVEKTKDDDLKLDYARLLIMLDRRAEATPWFKQLYASQPDNDAILYTLGLLYLEEKEYTFAEPLIKKLLKVPSRKYDANYFLGQIYEGQKRFEDALTAYENALPNTHFFSETLTRASQMIKREQDTDKALAWLDERLKTATRNTKTKIDVLLSKVELLQEDGRDQSALKVIKRAKELDAENHDVLYMGALIYERLGKFDIAERDLRTIIEANDTNAFAFNALGYLLTTNSTRYKEALKLIEKAIELSPKEPAIMDSLGWVHYRLGNLEKAEKHLREALDAMSDPEIASHLVEVLYKRGKQEEARTLLAEMLKKYPNDKLLTRVEKEVVGLK